MKRMSLLAAFVIACLLPLDAFAQAIHLHTTRPANFRAVPSGTGKPIELLRRGTELSRLNGRNERGYWNVRLPDGREGWVWGKYLQPTTASAPLSAALSASVNPAWSKPAPDAQVFSVDGDTCAADGDHKDPETNLHKNRVDVPESYHSVTFAAIAGLPNPQGPKSRSDPAWSDAALQQIHKYEGVAVTLEAEVADINFEHGEGTNCGQTKASEVDWHIALVKKNGDDMRTAIVAEVTPRLRPLHRGWIKKNVKSWEKPNKSIPVRVSGWLMFDPEHQDMITKGQRGTLWEVHPITRIEVLSDHGWMDLDSVK